MEIRGAISVIMGILYHTKGDATMDNPPGDLQEVCAIKVLQWGAETVKLS